MPVAKKGQRFGGRAVGTPNKVTGDVRAMILNALEAAGGEKYLKEQAAVNPNAFMALVGKTLPKEVKAELLISLSDRMRKILAGNP